MPRTFHLKISENCPNERGHLYPAVSGEQAVSYADVRRHRVALIRFIKRRLQKGAYRGYALKLEYGLDKTYHYHVLVLLNGDVVREAATISKIIGEYWKKHITEGKGGAYNCNAATYKKPGIGSIRYHEDEKRSILETVVAAYLTKVDFYVRMTKPDGHHAFWKSQPPKITPTRSGRKRTKPERLLSLLPSMQGRAPEQPELDVVDDGSFATGLKFHSLVHTGSPRSAAPRIYK